MSNNEEKSIGWTLFWFVVFFPVALYRIWAYQQFSKKTRVIVTSILFFPYGVVYMWMNEVFTKKVRIVLTTIAVLFTLSLYSEDDDSKIQGSSDQPSYTDEVDNDDFADATSSNQDSEDENDEEVTKLDNEKETTTETKDNEKSDGEAITFDGYSLLEVDGDDLSGDREPMAVVNIGFGDREYWAFTNKYGQLVRIFAKEIILQNEETEPVNSKGRYYDDEANVPGTELAEYDQGHVIADSLGGVANAYNITPQDSTLNRYGDQAYLEKTIRDAGGCTNFEVTITYPDKETQIPSKYTFTYTINGQVIVDEFENKNPESNEESDSSSSSSTDGNSTNNTSSNSSTDSNETSNTSSGNNSNSSSSSGNDSSSDDSSSNTSTFNEKEELARVDTSGNGKVTIKEAKAAGYSMPIYRDHWLYKYMTDRDGDGMVGE